MDPSEYPSEFHSAWAYQTLVTDPTRHMPYLRQQIEALGGQFLRWRVDSLQQLHEMFPDSCIFINASGLGSQKLADVLDDRCFPERGQNVFLRTDQCHTMYFRNGQEYTYVIPRPQSDGVVLGGVKQQDNLLVSPRNPRSTYYSMEISGEISEAEISEPPLTLQPGPRKLI